jgi:hypothetical protein
MSNLRKEMKSKKMSVCQLLPEVNRFYLKRTLTKRSLKKKLKLETRPLQLVKDLSRMKSALKKI